MRRLMVGVVLTVALLVVPATPSAAETSVNANGNVVKITIAVDVVGAKGTTSPDGTMSLVDYWETILNDTWGAAFGQISYKNCYRLELKLELRTRGDDFDSKKGNHRIILAAPTGGLTFEGTGFDGVPETSRNPKTGDGTRSFEHDRDGAIPVDAAPTVVAHEFGHLMGLGDDRENGAPKPGYDLDDIMVGGVPGIDLSTPPDIDKKVIDRLGAAIERYLEDQGKKLPQCQTWKGTIEGSGDNIGICENVSVHNGTFTIGVVPGGAILTGHMVNTAGTGCGAAGRPETTEASFVLDGQTSREGFEFSPVASFPFPVELEIAGDHATGSATESIGDSVYTVSLNFEADCEKNCDEEPVG